MESLSRHDVRRLDAYAIEALGVPSIVLMENAGRNAADVIEQFLNGAAGRGVAVVAGTSNNGGDGFVIARHLSMRGAKVVTFVVASEDKITPDARTNLTIIRNLGLDVRPSAGRLAARDLGEFDLVIDAIGGTGIQGPLRGDLAQAVEQVNLAGRPVVAIDVPTGLDCDTGSPAGLAIKAVMTITMAANKLGFASPQAAQYTGQVRVVDIGVPTTFK